MYHTTYRGGKALTEYAGNEIQNKLSAMEYIECEGIAEWHLKTLVILMIS
jgi:hypothetical protein